MYTEVFRDEGISYLQLTKISGEMIATSLAAYLIDQSGFHENEW